MVTAIQDICKSKSEKTRFCEVDYTLAPDVILLLISDGTARLLDLEGYFLAISVTGTEMLRSVLERDTTSAAFRIASHYGIEVQRVQVDLDNFLSDLKKRGLINHPNWRWQKANIKKLIALVIFSPVLGLIHVGDRSFKQKAWILLTIAYISIAIFGWATTVRVWQSYYRRFSKLQPTPESEKTIKVVDEVVRGVAAKHWLNVGCKERSLCCWAIARSAGLPVKLLLGVNLFPLASHCWCEFGSQVLSDYEDRCQRFTPICCYE